MQRIIASFVSKAVDHACYMEQECLFVVCLKPPALPGQLRCHIGFCRCCSQSCRLDSTFRQHRQQSWCLTCSTASAG